MRVKRLSGVLFACLALWGAKAGYAEETLTVGSPAPKLTIRHWVKGGAASLQNKPFTVVEFWATWCAPCRKAMPKLSELARKYRKTANFVGISVREAEAAENLDFPALLARVRSFVKSQGAKMDYAVAMDGSDESLRSAWLKAANRKTIPTTFVLDQDRKIAWIGFATDELELVLSLLENGKKRSELEPALSQKRAQDEKNRKAALKLIDSLSVDREPKKRFAILDEAFRLDPQLEANYGSLKFEYLMEAGEVSAALKYAKGRFYEVNQDNSMALTGVALRMLEGSGGGKQYTGLALKYARRALEVGGDKDGVVYHTIAFAYNLQGNRAKAIENQERAVALAKANPHFGPNNLKAVEAALQRYKNGQ